MFWGVLKEDIWKDGVPLHSWSSRGTLGQERIAMIFLFVNILSKYKFYIEKFTQVIFTRSKHNCVTITQPKTKNMLFSIPEAPHLGVNDFKEESGQGLRAKDGRWKRSSQVPAWADVRSWRLSRKGPALLTPTGQLARMQGSGTYHRPSVWGWLVLGKLSEQVVSHRQPYKARQGTWCLQRLSDQIA